MCGSCALRHAALLLLLLHRQSVHSKILHSALCTYLSIHLDTGSPQLVHPLPLPLLLPPRNVCMLHCQDNANACELDPPCAWIAEEEGSQALQPPGDVDAVRLAFGKYHAMHDVGTPAARAQQHTSEKFHFASKH